MVNYKNVCVVANRSDEEPSRIKRLKKLIDFIESRNPSFSDVIFQVHDHKGDLTVTIRKKTLEYDLLNSIIKGWNNENEYNVNIDFI
jgi:ribosomal protein S3AE